MLSGGVTFIDRHLGLHKQRLWLLGFVLSVC